MKELNELNGATPHLQKVVEDCLTEFTGPLIGCEFGVPFGGAVERIGKTWKGRGVVYGFDTFEGHPKSVAYSCPDTMEAGGQKALATWCMDEWYEKWGVEILTDGHIAEELARQGIDNVRLIKGLITSKSILPFDGDLHYAMLDLDFPVSMRDAYGMVKNRIVKGGYLCLHDVIPKGHIHGNNELYKDIISEGLFEVFQEAPESYLAIMKRI